MTAFELAGKLKLDSSEFSSSLDREESRFGKFGEKIKSGAQKVGKVAKVAFASTSAAAVMFTKSSIQEGLAFDEAMSQVAATLGVTTDEVKGLSKFARKMGSETSFSATEAAQALNYMALAGYDAETSMKMLPTVLNLAAAGNMDLATASDMVTDAQSALGLSTEETTVLVDQMAKTSSKTNTSVEQLGSAILTVGGTAKVLKGGTTELNAVLGILADNGIKGAEGGTALRNVMLSLMSPTKDAMGALEDLGVSVFDAEGNMRSLPEIMADINEATKGMTQEERTGYLSRIFNKRDLKAVEALLGASSERWSELFGEIGDSSGAASKMASTQLNNLAGDLKIFKSAVSEAMISVSDKLAPTLRKVVQKATVWVNRLTSAFNENGFAGAVDEAKKILKELITESLGIGVDSNWFDIGAKVAEKLKNGIKARLGRFKIKLADMLGVSSDSTWSEIATASISKIKEKITGAAGKVKVKVANLLGLTDDSGNVIDDPSDVSWSSVAKAAYEKIKTGFIDAAGRVKVRLSNLLGMTDSSGNPIDDPSDVTWGVVAKSAFGKIKEKFIELSSKAKVKLANWLGLTDDSGNVVDDPTDTSWSKIAEGIKTKLQTAFSNLKVSLASLLGITPENVGEDVSWEDIGREILTKLASYFSHKGDFLKKLILGDEFTEESTWLDVGKKISGWLEEAFAEGGILNAILGNAADKATAIASFAGELLNGFANWLSTNSSDVVSIITSIANAIANAAGPIVEALAKILSDPALWEAIGNAGLAIMEAIFGKKGLRQLRIMLGLGDNLLEDRDINEIVAKAMPQTKTGTRGDYGEQYSPSKWLSTLARSMGERGFSVSEIENALAEANEKFIQSGVIEKAALEEWLASLQHVETEASATKEEIDEIAGRYDVDIHINTYGEMPDLSGVNNYTLGGRDDDGGNAKGLWDVPYDDYHTILHRDEMVLNASRARDYREGRYNGGFNPSELIASVKEAIRSGMEGVSVRSYLNGKDVTDEVNRNNMQAVKARRFAH